MATEARVTDAATWMQRALEARDAQHTALVVAEAMSVSDTKSDPWAGEYRRDLHQAKLSEADAHGAYAHRCETAASDAADHELAARA